MVPRFHGSELGTLETAAGTSCNNRTRSIIAVFGFCCCQNEVVRSDFVVQKAVHVYLLIAVKHLVKHESSTSR